MCRSAGEHQLAESLAWLQVLELQAAGNLEAAAEAGVAQTRAMKTSAQGSSSLFKLLGSHVCQAYSGLGSWDAMKAWMDDLQVRPPITVFVCSFLAAC